MTAILRVLGAATVVAGVSAAAVAGWLVVGDTAYGEAAAAYARHPEHVLFRSEYLAAAARYFGLIGVVVGGLFGGAIVASLLFGLAEVLRRLPPVSPRDPAARRDGV
jgi:hypothetical protein